MRNGLPVSAWNRPLLEACLPLRPFVPANAGVGVVWRFFIARYAWNSRNEFADIGRASAIIAARQTAPFDTQQPQARGWIPIAACLQHIKKITAREVHIVKHAIIQGEHRLDGDARLMMFPSSSDVLLERFYPIRENHEDCACKTCAPGKGNKLDAQGRTVYCLQRAR